LHRNGAEGTIESSMQLPRWIVQSIVGIALACAANTVLDLQAQAPKPPQAGAKECGPGYTGTPAKGCADINECLVSNGECDPLTKCTNTVGGRTCGACPTDFLGDGYLGCKDVNECATTECKFVDIKAPVIRTSGNATHTATSPEGAVVTYTVTAVDNVDGPRPVECTPASGATFKVGTTNVTCTAVDKKGNKRSVVIIITVNPAG
jgi:hypothetical protein